MRETFKKDYYRMTGTKFSLFRFLFSCITEHRVRFVYTYRKLQCINKRRYLSRLVLFIYHRHLKTKYGLEINPDVKIGVGLQIAHPYNITINNGAVLGKEYTAESFNEGGVNPLRLLVCLVLSFILRKQINDPYNEVNRAEGLCMNLAFLNGEIMFVALFGTANYFARLANYFYIFPVIALPRLFNMVKPKWRIPMKVAVLGCYAYYMYYDNMYSGWDIFDNEYSRILLNEFHWFV